MAFRHLNNQKSTSGNHHSAIVNISVELVKRRNFFGAHDLESVQKSAMARQSLRHPGLSGHPGLDSMKVPTILISHCFSYG
jgi:hypothetical protein